jgi:hypothetical protein
VIYELGEPWWNDIDRGRLQTLPSQLSVIPTSRHLKAKQEEVVKEIMNLALRGIFILT